MNVTKSKSKTMKINLKYPKWVLVFILFNEVRKKKEKKKKLLKDHIRIFLLNWGCAHFFFFFPF